MRSLINRVNRIQHRTHVPVSQDDWRLLANFYRGILDDENVDPEDYREAAETLTEKLASVDPVLETQKYKEMLIESASADRNAYLTHMLFRSQRMAEGPSQLLWFRRDTSEGLLARFREIREQAKTSRK